MVVSTFSPNLVIQRCLSMSRAISCHFKDVIIVGAARTPIGSFGSVFADTTAAELGAAAIKGAINQAKLNPDQIEEVFLGIALPSGCGNAPPHGAVTAAGCNKSTVVSTLDMVCASGMKSVACAASAIQLGLKRVTVGCGMENMSMTPYYLSRDHSTNGNVDIIDGIVADVLTDAYSGRLMGACVDDVAKATVITRQQQDNFAVDSYKKSATAWENGAFRDEVVPIEVRNGKQKIRIDRDEQYTKVNFEELRKLKPDFGIDNGTTTTGNSSAPSDGAAACVLTSVNSAKSLRLKPLARILAYGDIATKPPNFATAPSIVIPKLLKLAELQVSDIDMWEINETFAAVPIHAIKTLKIDPSKVNIHGGGISLGHPLGMSGARIIVHLVHSLKPGQKGCAATSCGGGGASGIIIERL